MFVGLPLTCTRYELVTTSVGRGRIPDGYGEAGQLTCVKTCAGSGWPVACARAHMAAYCSRDGRCMGAGCLLGRLAGGGAAPSLDSRPDPPEGITTVTDEGDTELLNTMNIVKDCVYLSLFPNEREKI